MVLVGANPYDVPSLGMDTRYMSALGEHIRKCNREIDRAQEMKQAPDMQFLKDLENMQDIWKDAIIRFYKENGPQS